MKGMLALSAIFSFIFISCEVTANDGPVSVDLPAGTDINNVSFTVDTTYMIASPGMLVARGLATNDGSSTISSPWYVECQFYTDSTLLVKLGGNSCPIGVPLSPGQSVIWKIDFSSSNVDVRRFPAFMVSDFKATYENIFPQPIPLSSQNHARTTHCLTRWKEIPFVANSRNERAGGVVR